MLRQQVVSEQASIEELKVETGRLKEDHNQALSALAGLRKAEDLARQSITEAQAARDAAIKAAAAAETAKGIAEART